MRSLIFACAGLAVLFGVAIGLANMTEAAAPAPIPAELESTLRRGPPPVDAGYRVKP